MKIFFTNIPPLILGILFFSCGHQVKISDHEMDEDQSCFRISTPTATFFYQKEAGGFSSILDKDGNDWIGFHPDTAGIYPNSSASSYRGLPNMVYQSDDGGAGHPGFTKCISEQLSGNKIRTVTKSGKWAWTWTFENTYAILEVEKTDPDHAYWFLYEGIPGGKYQPHKQYWGTNKEGPLHTIPDFNFGNSVYDCWQWVYFGHEDAEHIFFIAQQVEDSLIDTFGYLGNTNEGVISPDGMVVFGLGREEGAKPLMTNPQKFVIGFIKYTVIDLKDHQAVSDKIKNYIVEL